MAKDAASASSAGVAGDVPLVPLPLLPPPLLLPPPPPPQPPKAKAIPAPTAAKQVWVLRDGQPVAVPVDTGASNGRHTEITGGELKDGMAVIVDYQETPR